MIRHVRLMPILAALLIALIGQPAARAAMPNAAQHDMLMLRAGYGLQGSLIAMPLTGSVATVRLPLGLLDRTAQVVYTAAPTKDGTHSLVRAVAVRTGRILGSVLIPGVYTTHSGDQSAATLSFNGRWLALRASTSDARVTQAVVIDTRAMRVAAALHLVGHFGLDALNAHGTLLYLVEHLKGSGPEAYRVRSYEVAKAVLDPGQVLEKGETFSTMSGVAWTRVWSPDGKWLYTFYVHPGRGGSFIHALGVEYKLAQCIDLPNTGASAADLAHYTLAISRDGADLYAVNPVLGSIAAVHGGLPFATPTYQTFGHRALTPGTVLDGSAVSADGSTVFVATGRGIWAMDSTALTVRATYLAGRSIASVVLSVDGRRLYALDTGASLVRVLDASSGAVLGLVPAQVGVWAVQDVMHIGSQ